MQRDAQQHRKGAQGIEIVTTAGGGRVFHEVTGKLAQERKVANRDLDTEPWVY
jgi:hypothetical protein